MSAQIIRLCDHRAKAEKDIEIDLCTAVDLSIRDLHDVEAHWGTELGRERLLECWRCCDAAWHTVKCGESPIMR